MTRVLAPEEFYHVGGAMSGETPSYVQREADLELAKHTAAGNFCYVLTPRQMGKSSLIVRTATQLKKRRIRSVIIDLQGKIERGMAAEAFYASLIDAFIRQLQLPVKLEQWWLDHSLLSATQRFSDFVRDEVLPRIQKRLVVFIDEIDSTLNLDFSDDFFAAIRAFYNERARNASFKRITVVMLGVAAPQDLIKDRARSPFNIGRRIELTDFTLAEAETLAAGLPLDKITAALCLARVFDWTGGHPYLTQTVCAALATEAQSHRDQRDVDHLIKRLFFSDATWSDPNLANTRDRLVEDQDYADALLELYRRILAGELVRDDERSPVHVRLKLSGIVKVFPGGVLRPRNQIYEKLFDLAWVDTVLHSDKLHQAIAALEAQQRDWGLDFTQQITELQQRLRGMGVVVQHGSGAVATTGGVAAGAGGLAVGGDVAGSVFIGGTVNISSGRYTGPSTNDPSEALTIYRRVLVDGCRHMSLRGLDVDASDPTGSQKRFDLAQVYVDLHTTTQVPLTDKGKRRRAEHTPAAERETRLLGVLEAVVGQRHVVLLGDPGSGKSTFVTHLALCLATHALEPGKKWLARLTDWPQPEADLIPVTVVLRDFARWLQPKAKKAEPRHLWNFIVDRLKAQNLAFVAKPLHDRLEHGGAILLLDGIDEIPTQRHRTFIRDAVAAFATRYSQCRVLVTCRTFSYQDPAWQLSDFQSFTLAPFSTEQIDRFIAAWHDELSRLGTIKPGAIEGASRQLQAAVRRPDLWRLASNPLLLTVMALVHTHKGRLPEARALLYEETIDILLWRWEQVKASGEDDAPPLRQLLAQANRTDVDLKRALWRLAFEAHREGGTTDDEAVADIGELRLNKTLVELHPDKSRDWAHQVVEVMKLRAGLLLERVPEVYTFPHRTFQEYLAGAHLSIQSDFAQQGSRLAGEGAFWDQVVLLAVGRLVYLNGETAKPLALVAELCPATVVDLDVAWSQAWLAGEALLEMGLNRVDESSLGRELVARVRDRLVQLLQGGHLSPVERAAAGNTLARLGDPRFRADAWQLPDEPLLGFVEISAGPFLMGSKQGDQLASDDEMPQHKLSLPRYYIARYPVTVAQFRAFVYASGYIPEDEDSLQGLLNHPVVNITWYEALKYCQWLTARLREWEGTPEPLASLLRQEGWQVTLPSEAEWEKTARGNDGRLHPWGDTLDPTRDNYRDTRILKTSAVGCFPTGASPYGCLDMAGNVVEWTRSLWEKGQGKPTYTYPYEPKDGRENLDVPRDVARVLRGGAFDVRLRYVRCAYRDGDLPYVRYYFIGFRVVVRPCL